MNKNEYYGEHYEILKKGVDVWNDWRYENPDVDIILEGVDLKRYNLSGVNFKGANLTDSDLSYADLARADLSDCYCRFTDFQFAKFYKTNLKGSYFLGSDFRGSYFYDVKFKGSTFNGAKMSSLPLCQGFYDVKLGDELISQLIWHLSRVDTEICNAEYKDLITYLKKYGLDFKGYNK